MLAALTPSPVQGLYNGMPVPPHHFPPATLSSCAPPRRYYCWRHGWNNTHHGDTCNIMGTNQAYTPAMRSARGPEGTGGNPKIGVPVHYSRPPKNFPPFTTCTPCLPPPSLILYPPCPPLNPVTSVKNADRPYEDNRAHVLQTLPLDRSEGKHASRVREMACLSLPRSHSASPLHLSPQSSSVSWSSPLVTLSMSITPRPLSITQDKITQATHQRLIRTQDSTRPQPKHPPNRSLNPTPDSSRFVHPNPFQALVYDPFPPDPSHPTLFPSPFFSLDLSHLDHPPAPVEPPPPSPAPSPASPSQALSSVTTPPLIADTG